MRLYKYLAAERIDVLENLLIRFTQPVVFNDPFECRPIIENDHTTEEWLAICEKEFQSGGWPEAEREKYKKDYREGRLTELWQETVSSMWNMFASTSVALCLAERH